MGEAKTWGGWPAAVDRGAAHIQWGQSLHCRIPVPEQLAAPDQIHKQERRGDLRMSDFHAPTESYTDTSAHQRWATYWNTNTASSWLQLYINDINHFIIPTNAHNVKK